ncbi:hypothetical protein ACS8E3_05160 [Psychrobacter sp. 2Y5]|uniref:hypothetical protein n=1 Tax=unclassified Psychrobacter TaxID=196806 RepID=UPI003F45E3A5
MQAKHLIIFALVGIAALIGFNIVNSSNHQPGLAETDVANTTNEPVIAASYGENTVNTSTAETDKPVDIANQPLGQQPKAIIDKVTTDIEQAQQIDKERLESNLERAQ